MLERVPRWGLHLAAAVVATGFLIVLATAGPPADFCTYYTAGQLALEGDFASAYDFEAINARHRELHPGEGLRIGSFLYSPLFVQAAAYFGALPFETAVFVNQLLILISLGGVLFLLLESTRSSWLRALMWVVFVLSDPVSNQFIYQNWSALLGLFVALGLFFTVRGKNLPAALFWALAIHLKAYISLFLIALFLVGRRRLAVTILVAGLLLIAVGLPWTGIESYVSYVDAMREQSAGGITYFHNQVSLPSTIARYEFPPSKWPSSMVAPSLAAVEWLFWLSLPLWGWLVWRLRDDPVRALALTLPYILLFVPKIWDHTQILFFGLFLTGVLARRTTAMLLAYLLLSFAYFALVQHLLGEAIKGTVSTATLHATLLYYPVLNVLALAAILAPPSHKGDPEESAHGADSPSERDRGAEVAAPPGLS